MQVQFYYLWIFSSLPFNNVKLSLAGSKFTPFDNGHIELKIVWVEGFASVEGLCACADSWTPLTFYSLKSFPTVSSICSGTSHWSTSSLCILLLLIERWFLSFFQVRVHARSCKCMRVTLGVHLCMCLYFSSSFQVCACTIVQEHDGDDEISRAPVVANPLCLGISSCLGYVLPAECEQIASDDRIVTARVILHPSLSQDSLSFVTIPT